MTQQSQRETIEDSEPKYIAKGERGECTVVLATDDESEAREFCQGFQGASLTVNEGALHA